ncbi:MAG: carbamoyl-phosphate synthase large subunit, partial [Pseudobdellovibrionaceae bacterium]
ESILGWKEFELEVMRDKAGTFVVVCNIENLDPCGVHTGDSITVAPQQTLSDRQYQAMRDEACKILNEVGVETGGANIQFATHPKTGDRVVIEMNPRVSRSSALASKATGFPIAKIAAQLAVGFTLDELKNDITKVTPCCYEPALDYIVTKIPRFAFEKFQGAKDSLNTQMKSVGEVMGIGRTFQESLLKALSSMEKHPEGIPEVALKTESLTYPNSQGIYHLFQAFRDGVSLQQIQEWTSVTPWFLEQIQDLVKFEKIFASSAVTENLLLQAKRKGFSDARLGKLVVTTEEEIRKLRWSWHMRPGFLQVDTCAGEFASETPYFYSSYWAQSVFAKENLSGGASSAITAKQALNFKKSNPAVVIIGSGPNRIGQGIEFDYSCVRAVHAFQKRQYPVVMVNSNPETVSTDYDTSDALFFEPLTAESLLEVLHYVQPLGFVAQLGGQTPILLSPALIKGGFKLLGSSQESIDLAEDRFLFTQICKELQFKIPQSAMAGNLSEALQHEMKVGYPMICRPSYVLGGRRMEVIENREELESYFSRHQQAFSVEKPCLMDQFLAGALEVDVDLVRGPDWIVVGGIVEHIEAAGVHSGDSMGVLPPQRLKKETCSKIEALSCSLADRMKILGHLNLQLAIIKDEIFILEANPRSSRSVPFVSKATGISLVDLAALAMLGITKKEIPLAKLKWSDTPYVSVKGVVFPFKKFPEADSLLGPEMKSTGESMGRAKDYSEALVKAFLSSHVKLPVKGEVFLSLRDKDKSLLLSLAQELNSMGYTLSATKGTAAYLQAQGLNCLALRKVDEGRPHCVDRIRSGAVAFVINTTSGRRSIEASFDIRRGCIDYNIPCITESDAAEAFILALKKAQGTYAEFKVEALSPMIEL